MYRTGNNTKVSQTNNLKLKNSRLRNNCKKGKPYRQRNQKEIYWKNETDYYAKREYYIT